MKPKNEESLKVKIVTRPCKICRWGSMVHRGYVEGKATPYLHCCDTCGENAIYDVKYPYVKK